MTNGKARYTLGVTYGGKVKNVSNHISVFLAKDNKKYQITKDKYSDVRYGIKLAEALTFIYRNSY